MSLSGRGLGSAPPPPYQLPKLCPCLWVISVHPTLAREFTALSSGWGFEARTMWLPTEEKPLVIKRGPRAVNTLEFSGL